MTDAEIPCPCHSAPLAMSDLIGCWKLVAALWERDGEVQTNPNLGEAPTGYLHYLAEGRVAVTGAMTATASAEAGSAGVVAWIARAANRASRGMAAVPIRRPIAPDRTLSCRPGAARRGRQEASAAPFL